MLSKIIEKLKDYKYESIELFYDKECNDYSISIKGKEEKTCICCPGELDFTIYCEDYTESGVIDKAIDEINNYISKDLIPKTKKERK